MGERSQKFFRISVDLTPDQHEKLEKMLDVLSSRQKKKISKRTLIHALLRQQAKELDMEWPGEYPTHGGPRK